MKIWKIWKALLMAFLVVFMPFTGVTVTAAAPIEQHLTLSTVDVHLLDPESGEEAPVNVVGAVGGIFTIKVTVVVDDLDETRQIYPEYAPFVQFPSQAMQRMDAAECILRGTKTFDCTATGVGFGTGTLTFKACDEDGGHCASRVVSVDEAAPTVSGVVGMVDGSEVENVATRGGTVRLGFTAADALRPGPTGLCSGIRDVRAVWSSSESAPFPIDRTWCTTDVAAASGTCTCSYRASDDDSAIEIDTSSFPDGAVTTVCLVATDRVGQQSTPGGSACVDIAKDAALTQVSALDFRDGIDDASAVLESVSSSTTFKAHAGITTSHLFDIEHAAISFPRISAAKYDMVCIKEDLGVFSCTVDVSVANTGSGEIQAAMEITDSTGVIVTESRNLHLALDTDAPVVSSIFTDYSFGGESYLKSGVNTIKASISESGAGFSGRRVMFDMNGISAPLQREASSCAVSPTEPGAWQCILDNIIPLSPVISVTLVGTDNAGNAIVPPGSPIALRQDMDTPDLKEVYVTIIGGLGESSSLFHAGDNVVIDAFIQEPTSSVMLDGGATAVTADLSAIAGSGQERVAPDGCQKVDGHVLFEDRVTDGSAREPTITPVFNCRWTVQDILASPFDITFHLEDIVGNKQDVEKSQGFITIYGEEDVFDENNDGSTLDILQRVNILGDGSITPLPVDDLSAPDYWKAGQPVQAVDINVNMAKDFGQRITYEIPLDPKGSALQRPTIADIRLSGCTEASGYLDEGLSQIIKASPSSASGRQSIWLWVTLLPGRIDFASLLDSGVDYLEFNCTLTIVSKVGSKLSNAEIEEVPIKIVFGAGVPELGEKLEQHIQDVKNSWLVQASSFEAFDDLFKTIDDICGILELFRKINAVLDTFNLGLQSICIAIEPLCFGTAETAGSIVGAFSAGDFTFWKGMYYLCEFSACRLPFFDPSLEGGRGKAGWAPFIGDPVRQLNAEFGRSVDFWASRAVGEEPTIPSGATGSDPTLARRMSIPEEPGLTIIGTPSLWVNPKNSLVMSVLSGCLPGFFSNLQRAREIECSYVKCLQLNVAAGSPVVECDRQRSYKWCMAVYGELFQIVPLAQYVKQFIGLIRSVVTDLFGVIGLAFGLACNYDWAGAAIFNEYIFAQASACRLIALPAHLKDIVDTSEAMVNRIADADDAQAAADAACDGLTDDEGAPGADPAAVENRPESLGGGARVGEDGAGDAPSGGTP
ncbi:hypothetical protein HYU19_02555 [Candidatus Woesearchaeota archaeon]|nr:hypothetical protein [Candidatus Woesearchaeota archaeon]